MCSIDDLFLIEQNTRKNALRIRSESVRRASSKDGRRRNAQQLCEKVQLVPVPPERLDFLKSAFHPTQLNVVRYQILSLKVTGKLSLSKNLKSRQAVLPAVAMDEGTGITANGSNTNGGSSGGDDKSSGGSRSQASRLVCWLQTRYLS